MLPGAFHASHMGPKMLPEAVTHPSKLSYLLMSEYSLIWRLSIPRFRRRYHTYTIDATSNSPKGIPTPRPMGRLSFVLELIEDDVLLAFESETVTI
jgi:hypothetical protein